MDTAVTYRLETFEGPLDLLLNLIHKNKVQIEDIPIALICDQYIEYIAAAEQLDMNLAVEFLNMASELMLIKSKMLLPRQSPEEEDPRAGLAEAIARLAAAKKAAAILGERYKLYGGRMAKDTDEISVDRTYVADGDPDSLYDAMRKILTYANSVENAAERLVRPIASHPMVPVRIKILGIMRHFTPADTNSVSDNAPEPTPTLGDLLDDAVSRPDLVAIFIGVLELVRMRRLLLIENADDFADLHSTETRFALNPDYIENPDDSDSISDIDKAY